MPQNIDHECGECKTYHLSQPNAQVKNVWRFTPFPAMLSQCGSKNTETALPFAVSSSFLTLR
jgi:hypothetical protein